MANNMLWVKKKMFKQIIAFYEHVRLKVKKKKKVVRKKIQTAVLLYTSLLLDITKFNID